MIRPFEERDLDAVLEIWLQSNLQAHPFIAESFWRAHFEAVKQALPQAEVFVAEADGAVAGFLGLAGGGAIAGLFVAGASRGQGIGRQLISKVKELYKSLSLAVYQKNARAVQFYRREGFLLVREQRDPETGELEYQMRWERQ